MSPNHSRNASEESNATTGSYNMILEHVLQYPGSYEIPLRTMYTLNCVSRAQPLPSRAPTPTGSRNTSPITGQNGWNETESATVNFTSQLMSHINSMPHQPSSLPPVFIISFVSRIFPASLSMVDFTQGLAALDYLRDLDNRRKKELMLAFERTEIHLESFDVDVEKISERFPGAALWAKNLQGKAGRADRYYAKIWLGLRRWILINELSLEPFNKLNCMGMLNTLLPPQTPTSATTPLLGAELLKQERDTFFHYIQLVQKKGPDCLKDLMEGGTTCWEVVQKDVDKYLSLTKHIIDECMSSLGTEDFKPVEDARKGKKTDSGVSFASDLRPATTSSTGVEQSLPVPSAEAQPAPKGLSKLERLTREFKRMRKSRTEVDEIVKLDQHLPMTGENKGKKIKKARSLANLKGVNPSLTSLVSNRKGSDAVAFDAEEMKRARKLYDATANSKGSRKHSLI